jgi:hypothetical protein
MNLGQIHYQSPTKLRFLINPKKFKFPYRPSFLFSYSPLPSNLKLTVLKMEKEKMCLPYIIFYKNFFISHFSEQRGK